MIYKKRFLLLIIFLIIILQTLLFTSNKQKTSFRYLNWTIQEVSIGKLISISFLSGLFLTTLLTTTFTSYKKNTLEDVEDNYEPPNNKKDINSKIDIPPERDIRDAQPTISVNYRVIKDTEENNYKNDQNFSNNSDSRDDWDNPDNDW
tara:strand:+ start:351 stop:794 length:444 start_codon:yes stop_codon:yes gene_type:complete